ncbi:MAG: endo-1,4-beta-xylanase [Phycisphaerae bacterium]
MLSFVVFDAEGVDSRHFPPRKAYLVGPDETPVQGMIELRHGVVDARKMVTSTVGLAVQLQVAGGHVGQESASQGLLTVHTCLLPDRDEPYLLTIELARRQIMFVLNKMEDWGLFDLGAEHPLMSEFDGARETFTQALVAQREGTGTGAGAGVGGAAGGFNPAADGLATKALTTGIRVGERMTLLNAERQFRTRVSGAGYRDAAAHLARLTPEKPRPGSPIVLPGAGHCVLEEMPQIGCAVSPGSFTEIQQRAILASCDFVTMPMRWVDLEPSEGKYHFASTDRWIEWAVRTAKLPVVAGPLVDLRPQSAPDFLFIWENDYDTLREIVQEHVTAVVTRYRRTISRWTVASGLNVNMNLKISFDQIVDLTKLCIALVRKLHPGAKVQLEVAQPWGEYHSMNRRSIPPLQYAETIVQMGAAQPSIQVDAIAIRTQMGHAEPGLSTRDLLSLSAMLDRFASLEKPIFVSSLGCPSGPIAPKPFTPRAGAEPVEPYEPGYWREPWSETQQASWLAAAAAVCASKPYVQGICWQDLSDAGPGQTPPEMPLGGLLGPGGAPKPSLTRLAQVRKGIKEGRWPLPSMTGA